MKILTNITLIAMVAISFFSCKKEEVTITEIKSCTMKQIYFTEEGSAYVLKSITKNLRAEVFAAGGYELAVHINTPVTGSQPSKLEFTTAKRIIPVIATLAIVDSYSSGNPLVDISTSYYWSLRGSSLSFDGQPSQTKLYPLVDEMFYTSVNFYNYNVRYNQAVFNDGDFIDASTGIILSFVSSKANAFAAVSTVPIVAAGTYDCSVNFLYFELQ
jgi:hypothetical protein